MLSDRTLQSQHNGGNKMMDWYDHGGMNGSWMIFMGIFWVIIIGLGFWFVTRLTQRDKTNGSKETPRQILDRRFASGEIDASEYAKARRLIDGHSIESDKIQ